jgi:hypothetical protein
MDSVEFELAAPTRGVRVAVRLRPSGERWVAVAEIANVEQVGVGGSARDALLASLGTLKRTVVAELLSDLRLLEVSCQVRSLTVA